MDTPDMQGHGGLHPIHAPRSTTTPTMAYVYLCEGTAVVFSCILLYIGLTQGLTSRGLFFRALASTFSCLIFPWVSNNVDVVTRRCLGMFFFFPLSHIFNSGICIIDTLAYLLRMHEYPRSHTLL